MKHITKAICMYMYILYLPQFLLNVFVKQICQLLGITLYDRWRCPKNFVCTLQHDNETWNWGAVPCSGNPILFADGKPVFLDDDSKFVMKLNACFNALQSFF